MTGVAAGAPAKIEFCRTKIRPSALIALGVGFFVFDRVLKTAALNLQEPLGWPELAEFTLFRNTGIAFSLPLVAYIFWPLAIGVLLALIGLFVRSLAGPNFATAALLSLIILGAASNLIDRRLYGATIDYLLFFGVSAINLADVLIVGGVAGLLLCVRGPRRTEGPVSRR